MRIDALEPCRLKASSTLDVADGTRQGQRATALSWGTIRRVSPALPRRHDLQRRGITQPVPLAAQSEALELAPGPTRPARRHAPALRPERRHPVAVWLKRGTTATIRK